MGVCEVVDSTVARYSAGIWNSPDSKMSTVMSCPSSEVLVHRDGEDQHYPKDVDMDGSRKSSEDKTEEGAGGQHLTTSSERRNKRKNFRPRNITDFNKDGHQDEAMEMDDAGELTHPKTNLLPKTSESFPMDLSVKPGQEVTPHKKAIDLSFKATTSPDNSAPAVPGQSPSSNVFPVPAEASNALKDYAESTMRELLGIYGLGDNHDLNQKRSKPFPHVPGSAMVLQHYPSRSDLVTGVKDVKSSSLLHPPTPPDTPRILKTSPSPSMSENSESSFLERSSILENGMDDSSSSVVSPVFRDNKIESIPYSFSGIADGAGRNYPSPSLAETSIKSVTSLMNQVATPLGSGIYSFSTKEPSSKVGQTDYSHYVKRYSSANECGSNYCKDLSYREHFHCVDCNSRVFVKKEEMIRHFKWHKKRDESLQHGFMRYSPADDCSDRFIGCSHNRKQTHYHCLKEGCDKVYISTSDVQMHANYHRKDSAILQEGFQRFRGCEDCGQSYCSYQGQKTTHFHCRRQGCQFTFKNKGDMDKHKSYHIKDDQLNKDGFKKYMKHEDCPFKDCRFSRVCNHIHCIRQGCSYVLHSSGQLYSHKRKHERRDTEMAYRKYQLTQSLIMGMELGGPPVGMHSQLTGTMPPHLPVLPPSIPSEMQNMTPNGRTSPGSYKAEFSPADLASRSEVSEDSDRDSSSVEIRPSPNAPEVSAVSSDFFSRLDSFDNLGRYIASSQEKKCPENCDAGTFDHYHCRCEGCSYTFTSLEGAREHARNHVFQDMITQTAYMSVSGGSPCPVTPECSLRSQNHFHCLLEGCKETVARDDKPFKRLEHYNMHDYSRQLSHSSLGTPIATPIDGIFRRKRGRPPKNRIIELPMTSSSGNSSTALFTSFKLPKPSNDAKPCSSISSSPPSPSEPFSMVHPNSLYNSIKPKLEVEEGFYVFDGTACPDRLCPHQSQKHYHCSQPRCFYVTDRADILILHSKDFHDNIYILEGFNFFDRSVDCRQANCVSNKINRHFHCTRPDCGFSFVRYSTMSSHEKHHQTQDPSEFESRDTSAENGQNNGIPHTSPSSPGKEAKVKAAGTFYPLSAFPMNQPSKANREHQSPDSQSEPANNMRAEDVLLSSKSSTENKIEERLSFPMHGIPTTPPVMFPGGMYPPQLAPPPQILYSPENACGRPFCKLKRKDHYHCHICSQAFTEYEKLHSHLLKHITCGTHDQMPDKKENTTPKITLELNGDPMDMDNSFQPQALMNKFEHPLPPHPAMSPYMFPPGFAVPMGYPILGYPHGALIRTQPYVPCSSAGYNFNLARGSPTSIASSSKGSLPESRDGQSDVKSSEVNDEIALSEAKRCRLNPMRLLKDEPVPEGYIRYRFNEDCGYSHCGYREHQTHFHCTRKDCGYSFCDKTRFVQHTARHERLDTLMGGDFHQFRANVSCGRPKCAYLTAMQNRASHFHCLKCDFVCTDTNKVVAHRRQHQKLDSIMAAGFKKFTPSQSCSISGCHHNQRQTHYHCLDCQFAVLGLSQMSAHRYRHEHQ